MARDRRLYNIWYNMKRRCYDEQHSTFEAYGAKGITIVDEWRYDFKCFAEWSLANGYAHHLTLDRFDSTKNYSPKNCRWATLAQQNQNRGMHKNNTSGVSGAFLEESGRYRARLARNFKRYHLGMFDTLEQAEEARELAKQYFEQYGTLEDYQYFNSSCQVFERMTA